MTKEEIDALHARVAEIEKTLPEDDHERAIVLTGMLARFACKDKSICPICLAEMFFGAYNIRQGAPPNEDKWLHLAIELRNAARLANQVFGHEPDVQVYEGAPKYKGES